MIRLRKISMMAAVLALLGVSYTNLMAQDTDAMINMAMENMKKIMMMPKEDRMKHMKKATHAALARGKAIYEDTNLGTNGQACASCHPGGKTTGGQVEMMPGMNMPIPSLQGVAGRFPKFKVPNDAVITLPEMNNNCLMMLQKGKPLPLGSQEARDLAAYVGTLQAG